jgi:VWFA-related protein
VSHAKEVLMAGRPLSLIVVGVLAAWLSAASSAVTAPNAQTPRFAAGTAVVEVDAQVVDRDGHPLLGLDAKRFHVTIGGHERRVLSANLVTSSRAGSSTTAPAAGVPSPATSEPPVAAAPPQTFIVAVDALTFDPGVSAGVASATKRFVETLSSDARVGLFSFPLGPRLDPTADHARVRSALDDLRGLRAARVGEAFHVRESEIVDYLASEASLRNEERNAILRQYCPTQSDTNCRMRLDQEIKTTAIELEGQARASLGMLRTLATNLAGLPGRKIVVLVSGGLAISDRPGGRPDVGDLPMELGDAMARANVTLYTLFLDDSLLRQFSAETASGLKSQTGRARDSDLLGRWLDQFSGQAGGAFIKVLVDSGEQAYARIAEETSAYYLLAVEAPEPGASNRAQSIKVKVDQRGATVRSRQWVVIPPREP